MEPEVVLLGQQSARSMFVAYVGLGLLGVGVVGLTLSKGATLLRVAGILFALASTCFVAPLLFAPAAFGGNASTLGVVLGSLLLILALLAAAQYLRRVTPGSSTQ